STRTWRRHEHRALPLRPARERDPRDLQRRDSTLMQALIAEARQRQVHVMVGGIDAANRGSIALHERLGFRHAGTLEQIGFKFGPDYGELKRMFVRPQHRGGGVARALLAFLEARAATQGCTLLTLETGIRQPEALGLYERSGFERCGPFGNYPNDPLSVFMRKRIEA